MKLIIAGGRGYHLSINDIQRLNKINETTKIDEVVSGCCTGADEGGMFWADLCSIPVAKFRAEWNKYGKSAGPIRNKQMAEYADAVVLFPGGRGTQSMYKEAMRAGITIFDLRGDA